MAGVRDVANGGTLPGTRFREAPSDFARPRRARPALRLLACTLALGFAAGITFAAPTIHEVMETVVRVLP